MKTFYFGVKETSAHDRELAIVEAESLEEAYKQFCDDHQEDVKNIDYINEEGSIIDLSGELVGINSKDRKHKEDRLISNDINDIQQALLATGDTEFLQRVLSGNGWKPYNQLTDAEIDQEYADREFPENINIENDLNRDIADLYNNQGYIAFEGKTREEVLDLIEKYGQKSNLQDTQNESLAVQEFLDLTDTYPSIKYIGYVITRGRKDWRVSIEGFEAYNLNFTQVLELQSICEFADESEWSSHGDDIYSLRVWYD